MNSYSNAFALKGVDGACFNNIGLPMINGGMIYLNGNHMGKFHGLMLTNGPIGSWNVNACS